MAVDFTKPVVGDAYASWSSALIGNAVALATALDPVINPTITGTPTGSIRFNAAGAKWEKYSGTVWADAAAAYAISITGSAGSVSAAAWSIITGKPTTLSGYGISSGDVLFASITAGNATTAAACSGNAATSSSCSGNAATSSSCSGNAATATSATTASNLAGGGAGTIAYQSAAGTTVQLAAGTAGQVLKSGGAAAPSWGTVAGSTLGTPVAATAVASISLSTTIPAGTKRLVVSLRGLQTGGAAWGIRIGPSGGLATTGYSGVNEFINASGVVTISVPAPTYLICDVNNFVSVPVHGVATLTLVNASTNTWLCLSSVVNLSSGAVSRATSVVALSGALTQVGLFSSGAFSSVGEANLIYD